MFTLEHSQVKLFTSLQLYSILIVTQTLDVYQDRPSDQCTGQTRVSLLLLIFSFTTYIYLRLLGYILVKWFNTSTRIWIFNLMYLFIILSNHLNIDQFDWLTFIVIHCPYIDYQNLFTSCHPSCSLNINYAWDLISLVSLYIILQLFKELNSDGSRNDYYCFTFTIIFTLCCINFSSSINC